MNISANTVIEITSQGVSAVISNIFGTDVPYARYIISTPRISKTTKFNFLHEIYSCKKHIKNAAFRPHFFLGRKFYQQDAFSASSSEAAEAPVDCQISFFVITSENTVQSAPVATIVPRRIISPPISPSLLLSVYLRLRHAL